MITSFVLDNLIFGTIDSGYYLKKLSGFGFPAVRVDVKDRGNYDGARLGNYRYGRRIMSIEGEIIGSTPADYETKRRAIEQAASIFGGTKTLTINTRGGLTLKADVIVNSEFQAQYTAGQMIRGDFRLELVAPYPFLQSTTENTNDVSVFDGGGGAVPSTIPFSLGAGGTGVTTLTNNGNGEVYPTVKIYGGIENPGVQNVTTSKSLSINYTLATSTDYIELDFYNRTAKLNGSTNILQYVSGDWWVLQPGDNDIKLTAGSSNAGALARFVWREAYIGI